MTRRQYFYPRSPCGERQLCDLLLPNIGHFYPRSPCGERRVTVLGIQHRCGISIHALLAESDQVKQTCRAETSISIHALLAESDICTSMCVASNFKFLSTLSLRRATTTARILGFDPLISIHALLAESDRQHSEPDGSRMNFYPRSPCGERLFNACST